ncbi:MAG: DUF2062 domain-containing protein [Planctomycetota bacterium]|jgi:uncharacterized protein (DUF2062 family)
MYRRHVLARCRLYYRHSKRFVLHNVLHADDPPNRLALGVAIGMFVAFTPTVGLQSGIVLLLAWMLRANKLVGLPLVWITNPVTLVPIYYNLYLLGGWILGSNAVGRDYFLEFASPPPGWWEGVQFYWQHVNQVLAPLVLGCLIASLVFAVPTYFAVLFVVRHYRFKRWGQLVPPLAKTYSRAKHIREVKSAEHDTASSDDAKTDKSHEAA